MNESDRFFAKVDRNGPVPAHRPELGPCHVWMACLEHGYGRLGFRGRLEYAHRVAFFLAHGRWPEPCALHHCDNRPCVNDAHLFEGTKADNYADMRQKGRRGTACGERAGMRLHPESVPRGERNGMAKLTDQDVRDIRANYSFRRVTQKELALRFGVTEGHIQRIVRGKKRRA